jgi:O-antigen/teichoic acid export membrane protein
VIEKAEPLPPNLHLQGFLHGTGLAAACLVFNGAVGLVTAIVFARWMQPESFGIYSIALVAITLLGGLGAAGMDTTVARFVAFYSGSGQQALIKPVLRFGVRRATVISITLAAASYAVLSGGVGVPARFIPLRPLALYVAMAIPLMALSLVLMQAILHLGAIKSRMAIEKVAQPLLRLLLPFACIVLIRSRLSGALAGMLLTSLFCVVVAGIVLRHMTVSMPSTLGPGRREIRTWSEYAMPFAFQSVQQFISSGLGIDIVLVGLLASLSASGIYAAAFRITLLLTLARVAMEFDFGPRVAALYGKADIVAIKSLYQASSTVGIAVTVPFAIILTLWSGVFMSTLFGGSYIEGAAALAWLVLGCVADAATGCNTTLLAMVGKPWLVLTNGMVGGGLTVALCLVLIPRYGITGAAFSATVARVCVNAMATAELWRFLRIQPFAQDTWKLTLPTAVTLLLGLFLKMQTSLQFQPGVLILAIVIATLLSAYLVGFKIAGLKWSQLV